MEIKTKKKVKAIISLLLSLNILAAPLSPIFAIGNKTALECDLEALNNTETNEETENFSSVDSLVQNDFSSEMVPTESDFLQMDLEAEVPTEDNFFQTVRQEIDFLETTSPQNTSEQGLESPASTPATQNDGGAEENNFNLADWEYDINETDGGVVLKWYKDNSPIIANVIIPGKTVIPGENGKKQVYIKGTDLRNFYGTRFEYLKNMISLKFMEVDGEKVKIINGSLRDMFRMCTSLKNFNGNGLDTTTATTMENMFGSCYELTDIVGLDNWDITEVINMKDMFNGCRKLVSLSDSGMKEWKPLY